MAAPGPAAPTQRTSRLPVTLGHDRSLGKYHPGRPVRDAHGRIAVRLVEVAGETIVPRLAGNARPILAWPQVDANVRCLVLLADRMGQRAARPGSAMSSPV